MPILLPFRPLMSLVFVVGLAAGPPAIAQQPERTDVGAPAGLEMFLSLPGMTRQGFVEELQKPLRKYDRSRDGLTLDDVEAHQTREVARARAGQVSYYTTYDADGDGRVTKEEVSQTIKNKLARSNNASGTLDFWKRVDQDIAQVMKADTNGDEAITFDEMTASVSTRKHKDRLITILFDLDPNKDGRITAEEVAALAGDAFRRHDRNGNGIMDRDEALPLLMRTMIAGEKQYQACTLPRPTPDDQVIVYGIFNGDSIASVAVAGLDEPTATGTLTIEPGQKPIYLVLTALENMIWRFDGQTARISRAIIVTGRGISAGVTGLQPQQVFFAAPGTCPLYSHDSGQSFNQLKGRTAMEYVIGRRVDLFAGAGRLAATQLPSGTVSEPLNRPTAKPNDVDARVWNEFTRLFHGGVTDIDPGRVIAPNPVERYDVLPGYAGILQLMRQGALAVIGERSYRIQRPIVRFPSGIRTGYAATFRLAKGVPMPLGSRGHFCVISDETGEVLVHTRHCQMN